MGSMQDRTPHSCIRAWAIWLVASLCLFFQFLVQLQPSAMIGELESSLALDARELGQLTSAYFLTYIVLQVPVGWLLDKVGPRIVLTISMLLTCAGMIWFGYASSLGSATAARIGLGVAGAPAFPAAALVAARWFPARRFALMMGLTEAFTLLGGVFVDIGLPQLLNLLGRAWSGIFLAVLAFGLAIACLLVIRDNDPSAGDPGNGGHDDDQGHESIIATVCNPRVWLAAIHGGLFFGVVAAFGGLWAVPFLQTRLELPMESAMGMLAILFLAGAVGSPLLGLIASSPRWRTPVILGASFVTAIAVAGLIYAPGGAVFIGCLLAIVGFVSGAYAIDLAYVRDAVHGARRGLAMGLANLVFGVIGGPLLLMVIAMTLHGDGGSTEVSPTNATLEQMRGGLAWFVGAMALLVPVGLVLVWLVHRTGNRNNDVID